MINSQVKIKKKREAVGSFRALNDQLTTCSHPSCFFCVMKESDTSLRRSAIAKCFKEMPFSDDQQHVLVLSGLWNIAMTQPNDPEFPSLGIFECMANLIYRGISDPDWLLRDQNIYIPYYAAHVIGSYTMNKPEFAEIAVKSGVVPPLLELLRGKISWVEQRVAVRALGHLASYETTFNYVAQNEQEVVQLAMKLASTCLDIIYLKFVSVNENNNKSSLKDLKYQRDLLTRGVGGTEMENRKAEEWASQLQCWSIYLLNCFASKERSLNLICEQDFLTNLSKMWGGLVNHTSPAGVGLIRILCYSKVGRRSVADSKQVIETLCNLSRSSDDWQYMGIDCLLLLLKDPETKHQVLEISATFLVDLVEIRNLQGRTKVGESINQAILSKPFIKNSSKSISEIWDLKQRKKREMALTEEELQERKLLAALLKQEGNEKFWCGNIEEAISKFTEALDMCPLKMRKQRVVLYSNRAQCHLLLGDPESAISDSTRALCLSTPVNSHNKSLWRRSQAYDMKGLHKESLMDCIMFVNGCMKSKADTTHKRIKVPYYAARMISKQMNATWLFAASRSKSLGKNEDGEKVVGSDKIDGQSVDHVDKHDVTMFMHKHNKNTSSVWGLATILEEPVKSKSTRKERSIKCSFGTENTLSSVRR